MAKPIFDCHDDFDLPGPLRLIVRYFREHCVRVQDDRDLDGCMQAANIVGAANMAQHWIYIYAGFVFTNSECQLAVDLINAECKFLVDELTKPGCEHTRPHPPQPEERHGQ